MNEMFKAQQYFDEAVTVNNVSLYTLALNGGERKYGMLDIICEYGSTPAANLAQYYAGMAYLNLKDYKNAIVHLSDFSSDDLILSALAKGGIGDSFIQLNQPKEALEYYEKAANDNANDFTTPLYLMKAARVAMDLGEHKKALTFLNKIKTEFPTSNESTNVEVLIGKAEASL